MNTYVGITLSLLAHAVLALALSAFMPEESRDFGVSSGPIVVRLQKAKPKLKSKSLAAPTLKKEAPAPEKKEVVSELPKGFDNLIQTFVSPDYPPYAIRKSLEGKVTLNLKIDKTGAVESVAVASSSGHNLLDQSALSAAKKWTFKPSSAPSSLSKEVIFQLR